MKHGEVAKDAGGILAINNEKVAGLQNSYENVEFDTDQMQSNKFPILLKLSNMGEIMYFDGGGLFATNNATSVWHSDVFWADVVLRFRGRAPSYFA